MTTTLSDLATAILDDKWILCSPEEAIYNAIAEFTETDRQYPYTYNDKEVTATEFFGAITELVRYFSMMTIEEMGSRNVEQAIVPEVGKFRKFARRLNIYPLTTN